jgi:hypothetical protein
MASSSSSSHKVFPWRAEPSQGLDTRHELELELELVKCERAELAQALLARARLVYSPIYLFIYFFTSSGMHRKHDFKFKIGFENANLRLK